MSVHEYEWEQPEGESYEWEQPEADEAWETYESYESSGEMHESLELELAQELLEVSSEEELEEFLGKLVSRVAKGARSFMTSGLGKAVGGVLRNVAKTALPMVGSALGSFVAPGLGTAIGGKLGGMAAKLLEAEELETMAEAEAELEAARRYVRWANGTVRSAMRAPRGAPPRAVARSAAITSARRYAPALVHDGSRRPGYRTSTSGRPSSGYRSGSQWRSRRRPRWSPPPWDPMTGWTGYRPTTQCTCGHADQSYADGDADPFGEDESVQTETYESFESEQSGTPSGRWYRRGRRIVLVGA